MPEFEDGRALLVALRERLDDWVSDARRQAYVEHFEGPDAPVTDDELRKLDRIDSELNRAQGQGLWNADEYSIVAAGTLDEESTPQVVCTYHPQLPEYVHRGEASLDEPSSERLDGALWDYSERVATLVQEALDEFVASSDVETWQE